MNIKTSKFYSEGTIDQILTASWVANNDLHDIPTNKFVTKKQLDKIKNLNSSTYGYFTAAEVKNLDDPIDYTFDEGALRVLNEYLTDEDNNWNTRMCGYIRLYSLGFFEDWADKIEKAPDLIETGDNVKNNPPHNIYDDLVESINNYNAQITSDLKKIIDRHKNLQYKELEILRIRTTHQLTYFMNRISKIIHDQNELALIEEEVGQLRNKYVVDKESKLAKEFIEKYPNYISYQYYSKHGSEFSNDLARLFPTSTAIAINKNVYGACEITLI